MSMNQNIKKVGYVDPSDLLSRIEKLEKEVEQLKLNGGGQKQKIKWYLEYISKEFFTPMYLPSGMQSVKSDTLWQAFDQPNSFSQFATEEECKKFCSIVEAKAEEIHLNRVCNVDPVKNDTYYKIEWDNNMNSFCINQTIKNAKTSAVKYNSYRNAEKALELSSPNLKAYLKGELY